ncbi:hypothetical protein HID58_022601 [Brassica napus]|uniref:Replication factor A C-terminal domain-containing protein n=1 Tax=Brassica napus TaxID=3708 RepID=A0ABQ8D1E1_BRANA|nr:hypothetical protein HID58_022601 [Brassica napus]
MATKPNGKSPVLSASDEKVMLFRDVSLGPHETQLRFRLIHFWEAWNPIKKTLIGLEMLLIDEQNNKSVYRVSDHAVTVSLSLNSKLSVLEDITTPFDEDRFLFHSYEVFEANCDLKGDLYDVVGHMKLVNGHTLTERPVLDEVQIAAARHLLVHLQLYDGPVIKVYLWDNVATEFCRKFKSCETTPTVLLITTVNTKRLGGTLALTSMSSSRVFMDYDVQPTIDYFAWLGSYPEVVGKVNADVVTKREQLTIGEIFSDIKQESAKEAFFECTATIDDVFHGSAWYYISCSGCHTKATKGQTSLMCAKCGKANADIGVDQEAPVPEALINTIGQRHKFSVKVTEHNLSGKTRALTVTEILPLDTPTKTETSE